MEAHVQIGEAFNLQLRHAVLIYEDQRRTFATLHEVLPQTEGAPLLAPAKPLSLAFVRRLSEGLGATVAPEVFPASVLAGRRRCLRGGCRRRVSLCSLATPRRKQGD